jgi:hypothetical protein
MDWREGWGVLVPRKIFSNRREGDFNASVTG